MNKTNKILLRNNAFFYIALFFIAIFVSYFEIISLDKVYKLFEDKKYHPILEKTKPEEINFIYIGSSQCGFSNNEETFTAVDKAMSIVKNKAQELGLGFSAIGIAPEWNVNLGIAHLENVSNFNEIIVGNNWGNSAIVKNVREFNIEPSTPQILITFKKYNTKSLYLVENEILIQSIVGKDKIINWVNSDDLMNNFKLK